jgi:hypothetical protein
MFERNEAIVAMVEKLWLLARPLDRGDVLTHDAIQGALGVGPHEGSWDHVVGKLRARLRKERGIATWPEVGVGYRLCTKEEQLDMIPEERAKKARRQFRRAEADVRALPVKGLSQHQKRLRAEQLKCLKAAREESASQARRAKLFGRRRETPPPFASAAIAAP